MKVYITKGNTKLPKSTYILNVGPALLCPSRLMGLCQCPEKCFARRTERLRERSFYYHVKQAIQFQDLSAEAIAIGIIEASNAAHKHQMKVFRYNEAGDFYSQSQVEKMACICSIINKEHGAPCYGYTARTDLDLTPLLETGTLSVSNDDGNWVSKGANRFKVVSKPSGKHPVCAMNCRICHLCKVKRGCTIEVVEH